MNTLTINQLTNQQTIQQHKLTWTEAFPPRQLGDGLVLRFATPADTEPLAQFNGRVFGNEKFDELAAVWTRSYMSDEHPTCGPSNVSIVEDTRTGQIVSAMCLIPQTWTFAGIPFGVGRPEAVATDPAYRRRGLIRMQFGVMHERSAAMGHLVQGITGIPWYYRQFGYEYALELGGGRLAYLASIPPLKEGETESYHIRPMTMDDVPLVAPLYERDCSHSLVACPRPDWQWQRLLKKRSSDTPELYPFRIIETEGRVVGYFAPSRDVWREMFFVNELAVIEGQSLRAVMPSVLRELKTMAEAEAITQKKPISLLSFTMPDNHPIYTAIPEYLPRERLPYGWYIRVADVPGFIRHIAPVLEARLAASPLVGYSGELKIHEYVRGLRIVFENGKITNCEAWQRGDKEEEHAAFPPLVFLQLLFGYRSLAELRTFFADVWAQDEADALLKILFPRQGSYVMPIE